MSLLTPRLATEKAAFRPALALSLLPGVNGTHMGKMSYSDQLKHPFWQRKRLEVMESAGFACECCGDKETTFHVHHKRYVKGRLVWEYEGHELQLLCAHCHASEHESQESFAAVLAEFDDQGTPRALIAGFADARGIVELSEQDASTFWFGDANAYRLGQFLALYEMASADIKQAVVTVLSGAFAEQAPQHYAKWKEDVGISAQPRSVTTQSDVAIAACKAFSDLVENIKATRKPVEGFE